MKKIGFAVAWDKKKDETWSGTPYSILNQLKTRYEVVEYDLALPKIIKFLFSKLSRIKKVITRDDFNNLSAKLMSRKFNKKMKKEKTKFPIITFCELRHSKNIDTYLYVDLTIDFLACMAASESNLLAYTPLPPEISQNNIQKKLIRTRRYYDNCSGMFTMSKWLCEYMKNSGNISPNKVHHVGGGSNIDVKNVDFSLKSGKDKFLFVGRDFERKNGPLVIEAFKRVRERYNHVELYIAGPVELSLYESLPEGVIFLGPLKYDELVFYYNLCDYFVMPSRFEAYGLVFAEALIYGLPCIGKDCYAMPEFISNGQNGYLIKEDDPEELKQCMIDIIEHKEIVQNVMENQDEYINEYSWNTVVERIKKAIENEEI